LGNTVSSDKADIRSQLALGGCIHRIDGLAQPMSLHSEYDKLQTTDQYQRPREYHHLRFGLHFLLYLFLIIGGFLSADYGWTIVDADKRLLGAILIALGCIAGLGGYFSWFLVGFGVTSSFALPLAGGSGDLLKRYVHHSWDAIAWPLLLLLVRLAGTAPKLKRAQDGSDRVLSVELSEWGERNHDESMIRGSNKRFVIVLASAPLIAKYIAVRHATVHVERTIRNIFPPVQSVTVLSVSNVSPANLNGVLSELSVLGHL
jgi:hypothetical protein